MLPEDVAARIPFRFFPSLAEQQAAIMPSLEELAGLAATAGFARVRDQEVRRDSGPRLDETERSLRRDAARRYPFLSGRELDEGLERMRSDWERSGRRWTDPRPTRFIVAEKA